MALLLLKRLANRYILVVQGGNPYLPHHHERTWPPLLSPSVSERPLCGGESRAPASRPPACPSNRDSQAPRTRACGHDGQWGEPSRAMRCETVIVIATARAVVVASSS